MGFSGFEFIRGIEADAWHTDPIDVPIGQDDVRDTKRERHFRNLAVLRRDQAEPAEETYFPPRTFGAAADWLERNHTWPDFYLHIDSFPPHEPCDPPDRLVRLFDERGVLLIRSTERMLGYLNAPEPFTDGWYDTGDVVEQMRACYLDAAGR